MFLESIRHRRCSKGCLAISWTNLGGWRCSETWLEWEAFWSESKMTENVEPHTLDSEQTVQTSVTNNSSFQSYHRRATTRDELPKRRINQFKHESKVRTKNNLGTLSSDRKQRVCFVTGRKEDSRVRKIAHSRKPWLVKNITFVSCHNLRVHGTSCLASSCITLEKPRSEQKWPAAITP